MVFSALLYFALYCYYIRRAFSQLKLKSASDFRILNIVIRIQVQYLPQPLFERSPKSWGVNG